MAKVIKIKESKFTKDYKELPEELQVIAVALAESKAMRTEKGEDIPLVKVMGKTHGCSASYLAEMDLTFMTLGANPVPEKKVEKPKKKKGGKDGQENV